MLPLFKTFSIILKLIIYLKYLYKFCFWYGCMSLIALFPCLGEHVKLFSCCCHSNLIVVITHGEKIIRLPEQPGGCNLSPKSKTGF